MAAASTGGHPPRPGSRAEWERVILYRLTDQRIAEITFFDYDVRPLEHLLG